MNVCWGVLQIHNLHSYFLTNILLLIARCFPGCIEHSFLSVLNLLSAFGTYAWITGCLSITGLISPLMLLSLAYDNHFHNILSQCKEIRTSGAFCSASKNEGVRESYFKFPQRQCNYAYACWVQLLHRLLERCIQVQTPITLWY